MQPVQKSPTPPAFWSLPEKELLDYLKSSATGLTEKEATSRLAFYGLNTVKPKHSQSSLSIFLNQFKSPITILLVVAALLSFFLRDPVDAVIILIIITAGSMLSFWQEKGANDAVKKLMSIVQIKAKVKRDGKEQEIPVEKIVPGDCVVLQAGDTVPADARILESNVLFIDEAAFTGETYPVEKTPEIVQADTPLAKRSNTLYMGSHVISGSAVIVIVNTGHATEFGAISKKLSESIPPTEFERGVKKFGYLLTEVTLILVIIIFAINVLLHKPVLDSLLFSLAIAVGLTPQLLPAIISVNLSRGAKRMAEKNVVVKRLSSIENFGSMDILCSDKTGTLTEGKVTLDGTWDYTGQPSARALELSIINASLQLGFRNPIDDAICEKLESENAKKFVRLSEVPYDFIRKKLTILAGNGSEKIMISKGALKNILENCSQAVSTSGEVVSMVQVNESILERYKQYSAQGLRTLGVAYKNINTKTVSAVDETDMIFAGFITLFDPPKEGVHEIVGTLKKMGVTLKVITGDNAWVAAHLGKQIGVENPVIVTGSELRLTSDAALMEKVMKAHIFAEVEPNQKEKIILALQKRGHVVGFLGDGINDASALHRADVGISVDTAVDVAKGAADIILLDKDLGVLINGIREGRKTFANTLKYVFMATSANFGNMFSVAGASLFLPFLPLLPKQILLANILTDLPELAIASDRVDAEAIESPHRWDISFIRKFMLVFGALSSVFDYLTFGILLWVFDAGAKEFQTAWFVESVISAASIVLIVRTRGAFYKSKPGKYLLLATTAVVLIVLYLPFSPVSEMMGFTSLPVPLLLPIGGIILMYVVSAELIKKWFYKFNRT